MKSIRTCRIGSAAAALVFFVALLAGGCSGKASTHLTVKGGEAVVYEVGVDGTGGSTGAGGAAGGSAERITARYYSLSDDSLSFVKVTMPDGKIYTLPNVVSASGARYSDDRELVWWTKGDTAFAEKRGEDGQWKTVYTDCRVIAKGKQ